MKMNKQIIQDKVNYIYLLDYIILSIVESFSVC